MPELIKETHPHVLVQTKKELHGWYKGKRECTAERLLINPYNGCSVNCFYCYARALPGYFETFHKSNIITVAEDFDKVITSQLDSISVASCGYLSPVCDPFQSINKKYRLSEKIIQAFTDRNIPIEFITKCRVSDEVIDLIKSQKHSFGQVSILTPDEQLRRILSPGGAETEELFNNLKRFSDNGIFAVCRIDPIMPYITDKGEDLRLIVEKAIDSGARHIIASVLDIPVKTSGFILNRIKERFGEGVYSGYKQLYTENIGYMNAGIDYRKRVFGMLRNHCDKKGLTFALCMEYELKSGSDTCGLNKEFMSSVNCEGINIPVYIRKGAKFYPAVDCKGNCLDCSGAECGIEELAMGKNKSSKKDFKLKDYRKWSRGG